MHICNFYCTFAPDFAEIDKNYIYIMSTFIIFLIVLAAILLILLVLVQNSKGGGLASGFAGGNQVMGAPKTADFLEKATWSLIAVIVFLSIIAVGFTKSKEAKKSATTQTEMPVVEKGAATQSNTGDAENNGQN